MPEILINVINKIPVLSGDVRQITADNGDYTVRLVFDDDWTDGEKTVLFVRENGFVYPAAVTKDNTAAVPAVVGVAMREWLYVGVKQGEVHTSRPCGIPVYRAITDMIDDDAVQPELSLWESVLARIEELEKNGGGDASEKADKPVHVTGVLAEDGTYTADGYTVDEIAEMALTRDVRMILAGDGNDADVILATYYSGAGFVGTKFAFGESGISAIDVIVNASNNESTTGLQGSVMEAPAAGAGSSGGLVAATSANIPCENKSVTWVRVVDGAFAEVTYEQIVAAWADGTVTLCVSFDLIDGEYSGVQHAVFRPIVDGLNFNNIRFEGVYWVKGDAALAHGLKHAEAQINADGTLTITDLDDESGMLLLFGNAHFDGEFSGSNVLDKNMTAWTAEMLRTRVAARPVMLQAFQDELGNEGEDGYFPALSGTFRLDSVSGSGDAAEAVFHGEYWGADKLAWVPAVAIVNAAGELAVKDAEWDGYAKQAEVDLLSEAIADIKSTGIIAVQDGDTLTIDNVAVENTEEVDGDG